MPERTISLFNANNALYVGNLNEGDDLKVDKDDNGNFVITVKNAAPQGEVHEVAIGPGAVGGVAKVFPPITETAAVQEAQKPVPASAKKGASAKDRKGVKAEEAQPAEPAAPDTSGETPPESGGKAGTNFSGQVSP